MTAFWYNLDKNEVGTSIWQLIKKLDGESVYNRTLKERYLRRYSRKAFLQVGTIAFGDDEDVDLKYNITKAAIDTAVAKIATKKVKPFFLTQDGDIQLQAKAKKLNIASIALLKAMNVHSTARSVFRDACIFGRGFLKIYSVDDEPVAERINPLEIIIDEAECAQGSPRSMFQVRSVPKEVVAGMFPKSAKDIATADVLNESVMPYQHTEHLCTIVEAWHLPAGKVKGVHTITTSNGCLFKEDYTEKSFPFAMFSWNEAVVGFWGEGLCEEIEPMQVEINYLLRKVQQEMDIGGTKIYYREGSVDEELLTNERGSIIPYTGNTPPQVTNPSTVSNDTYRQIESLIKKTFESTGISAMSARGRKEAGVTSGVAIREVRDIESERFQYVEQQFEEFIIDATRKILKVVSGIPAFKILTTVYGFTSVQEIDLPEDKYTIQVHPTNFFAATPAAKKQQVMELSGAGLLDKNEVWLLLGEDYPDLQFISKLENAPILSTLKIIDDILVNGVPWVCEPFMDASLGLKYGNMSYLDAIQTEIPEEHLELLRRFIDSCAEILKPKQPTLPPVASPVQPPIPTQLPLPPKGV